LKANGRFRLKPIVGRFKNKEGISDLQKGEASPHAVKAKPAVE
jgi:hypothetical protein